MTSYPRHSPRRWSSFGLRAAASLGVMAALATASVAHATCEGPEATILWSYPDAATASVPPNAVFWVVSHAEAVTVEVDGVALEPRGTGAAERHQYVPAAALSAGPHELVARASQPPQDDGERRVPFQVVAGPEVSGAASISAVTRYPVTYDNSTGERLSPPDDGCSEPPTSLVYECNDLIPTQVTRVDYASEGDIIAYLAQGSVLVPPACASFWTSGSQEAFDVAAVLPSGVTEYVTFTGAVDEGPLEETLPDDYQQPRACSIAFGRATPSSLGAAASVALAAWCARRRRR